MADGVFLPRDGVVGADHDLPRAHLGRQVAQRLAGEHQRVEVDLPDVLGRLLLQLDVGVAVLRRHEAAAVHARRVRAQKAAAVRAQHLQLRVLVEHAFEDQLLLRDGGVQRVADHVGQPAVALEARRQLGRALRVDEQHHAQLLRLGQHRVVGRVGEVVTGHAAADGRALQAVTFDAFFQLLHRQVGELHGQRCERGQAFGVPGADLGQAFVVDAADGFGRVAVLLVPVGVDAQHLQVDAHAVHRVEARGHLRVHLQKVLGHALHRRQHGLGVRAHQVQRGLEVAVRVHVHRARALAADDHGRTLGCGRAAAALHDGQARAAAEPEAAGLVAVTRGVEPVHRHGVLQGRLPDEAAACSTARIMRCWAPQRHRWGSSACTICGRLGDGCWRSSAAAEVMMPATQ